MESTQFKAGSQLSFSIYPHFLDSKLPDLVPARLARPCRITVALLRALVGMHATLLLHVRSSVLHAPAEMVDACVHDKAHCAHHLQTESAEELVWGCVHAHLLTQPLTVERPSPH